LDNKDDDRSKKEKKEKMEEAFRKRRDAALKAKREKRVMDMTQSIINNNSTRVFFSSRGIEVGLEDAEELNEEKYVRMTLKELLEKVDSDLHS